MNEVKSRFGEASSWPRRAFEGRAYHVTAKTPHVSVVLPPSFVLDIYLSLWPILDARYSIDTLWRRSSSTDVLEIAGSHDSDSCIVSMNHRQRNARLHSPPNNDSSYRRIR